MIARVLSALTLQVVRVIPPVLNQQIAIRVEREFVVAWGKTRV